MEVRNRAPIFERNLGMSLSANDAFNPRQEKLLKILTLVAASISIAAGLFTVFCFVRMKRRFRHNLIMLLIISSLFKSVWYFIFPVVGLVQGTVQSQSAICQVSGFMVSFGNEGSDLSILMISIHVALTIFFPPKTVTVGHSDPHGSGYTVYVLWVTIPLLLASLPFMIQRNPYIESVSFCLLPVRPIWLRLALSWIPRYIVFFTILLLALAISIYIHRMLKELDREVPKDSNWNQPISTAGQSDTVSSQKSPTSEGIEVAVALPDSELPLLPDSVPSPQADEVTKKQPKHCRMASLPESYRATRTFLGRNLFGSYSRGVVELTEAKKIQTSVPPMPNIKSRHQAVRRQLRLLFVYPLTYLLIWILPLITSFLSYDDNYAKNPNFTLAAVTFTVLALQCAIDCLVFSIRETPWKQPKDGNSSQVV